MKFLVIFENYDIANEISDTLRSKGNSTDICLSFEEALECIKEKNPNVVIASDMAVTNENEDRYSLLIGYLKEISHQVPNINLLCKKKAPLSFLDECKKLNIGVETAAANDETTEIDIKLDEPTSDICEEIIPDCNDLKVMLALGEEHSLLEKQIRGIQGVNVVKVVRTKKELREQANEVNPDAVLSIIDLPNKEDGNWIDICNDISLDIEIYIVKTNTHLNELIEKKLKENHVIFIDPDPKVSDLKEALFPKKPDAKDTEDKSIKKTKVEKVERGKRPSYQLNQFVGSVTNVTQNALSAVTEATKAVKSINLSFNLGQGTQKKINNLIVVCSPAPTGRSFVAQNTAATLAKHFENIALVDLDKQVQYICFKLSFMDWEEEYKAALERTGSFERYGYETNLGGRVKGTIRIFSCEPQLKPKINASSASKLIKYAAASNDYVVVDMPRSVDLGYADTILSMAATIIIVADMDVVHLQSLADIKNKFDDLEANKVMVLNRFIKIDDSPEKDILSVTFSQKRRELPITDGVITIPDKPEIVSISRCIGKPASIMNPEISLSFNQIYQYIQKVGG